MLMTELVSYKGMLLQDCKDGLGVSELWILSSRFYIQVHLAIKETCFRWLLNLE